MIFMQVLINLDLIFRALEEAKDRREQIKAAHNIDKEELKKLKHEVRELKQALENADSSKQ